MQGGGKQLIFDPNVLVLVLALPKFRTKVQTFIAVGDLAFVCLLLADSNQHPVMMTAQLREASCLHLLTN